MADINNERKAELAQFWDGGAPRNSANNDLAATLAEHFERRPRERAWEQFQAVLASAVELDLCEDCGKVVDADQCEDHICADCRAEYADLEHTKTYLRSWLHAERNH